MANDGKSQLLITFVATPEMVGAIDRLVASHAAWMAATHHREGSQALLSYNFSKGPELANSLDPGSEPTATRATSWTRSTNRRTESQITGSKRKRLGTTSRPWSGGIPARWRKRVWPPSVTHYRLGVASPCGRRGMGRCRYIGDPRGVCACG